MDVVWGSTVELSLLSHVPFTILRSGDCTKCSFRHHLPRWVLMVPSASFHKAGMTLTYDPTTAALHNGYVFTINASWLEGQWRWKVSDIVPWLIPLKGLLNKGFCVCSRFYPSPYSIATNRMITQTSLTPYIASPVSAYQVCTSGLVSSAPCISAAFLCVFKFWTVFKWNLSQIGCSLDT